LQVTYVLNVHERSGPGRRCGGTGNDAGNLLATDERAASEEK
jgi:hypothetical protein